MFLKSLSVYHGKDLIRNVEFKTGLNIITDSSNVGEKTSGNNVGKSTALRVVDYCLGAKASKIYKDDETGTENPAVKKFIESKLTRIRLVIVSDEKEWVIERVSSEKPQINNVAYEEKDFKKALGQILFNLHGEKPSFRQLLSKFVRVESYQFDKIFKFLFPTSTLQDYENLYLHLFGFQNSGILTLKTQVSKEIKRLNLNKRIISEGNSKTKLRQIINAYNKEIEEFEKNIGEFRVTEGVLGEVSELEKIRTMASEISIKLSESQTRVDLAERAISELEDKKSIIDTDMVSSLYNEATSLVGSLNKSFEEVLEFHNRMIDNKIKFINKNTEKYRENVAAYTKKLRNILKNEELVILSISKKEAFEGLLKENRKLAKLMEERSEKKAILNNITNIEDQLERKKSELVKLNQNISEFESKLEKECESFNNFYKSYSEKLYGEKYFFGWDRDSQGSFKFTVFTVGGAVGAGKKKGQISAFDLAFLSYLDSRETKTCRFQINDRLEEISLVQLRSLFEIANQINGQFVISILKDRIGEFEDDFLASNVVLTLSQEEKFFKLK